MPAVFFSYSHQDEPWRRSLENHLQPFEILEGLQVYSDKIIHAGEPFREKILQAITLSQVAVLLLSADFLRSKFIREVELPLIRERHEAGELQVIPVLVQHCLWSEIPWLKDLQIRPWNAVPLAAMRPVEREEELVKIVLEILSFTRAATVSTP